MEEQRRCRAGSDNGCNDEEGDDEDDVRKGRVGDGEKRRADGEDRGDDGKERGMTESSDRL